MLIGAGNEFSCSSYARAAIMLSEVSAKQLVVIVESFVRWVEHEVSWSYFALKDDLSLDGSLMSLTSIELSCRSRYLDDC